MTLTDILANECTPEEALRTTRERLCAHWKKEGGDPWAIAALIQSKHPETVNHILGQAELAMECKLVLPGTGGEAVLCRRSAKMGG